MCISLVYIVQIYYNTMCKKPKIKSIYFGRESIHFLRSKSEENVFLLGTDRQSCPKPLHFSFWAQMRLFFV